MKTKKVSKTPAAEAALTSRERATFAALYDYVQKRPRPEDVAEFCLEALDSTLGNGERRILEGASKHSIRRTAWGYSSMAADFWRPKGVSLKSASELFDKTPSAEECLDPDTVERFIKRVSPKIRKAVGKSDFKADRLNRAARKAAHLNKGHRWYNKRFRILARMEDKLRRLIENQRKYRMTRISKGSLSIDISRDDFYKDIDTACLIAYLSARMGLRSTFTNESQVRAFDEVSDMLLKRCERHPGSVSWKAVAHVMPDKRILKRLDDVDKGKLMGEFWQVMEETAQVLSDLASKSEMNLKSMVVKKGNDSSTWNAAAGAWNKARMHWVSLVHDLGMDGLLKSLCPGKSLRLMAADVAYWHKASGGDVHPDTKVWSELPFPWEVMAGEKTCTMEMVEEACKKHGVKVETWAGPVTNRKVAKFTPTPELVHGVTVSSPGLAKALRKAGAFSGKAIKGFSDVTDFHMEYDDKGFAKAAVEGSGDDDSRTKEKVAAGKR